MTTEIHNTRHSRAHVVVLLVTSLLRLFVNKDHRDEFVYFKGLC